MKKTLFLLTLIVTLMMALSTTAMAADSSNVTYINNADDFLFFAISITDSTTTTKDKTWQLTANIDLRALTGSNAYWPGIGSESNPFQGTFIATGYTITLLTNSSVSNDGNSSSASGSDYSVWCALFNYIGEDAIIQDVTLEGTVTGSGDIGGVVTYSYGGTITNCVNNATVTSSAGDYTGGIVAYADSSSTISGCSNTGDITGTGSVGGVAGYTDVSLTNCTDSGTVNGSSDSSSGGTTTPATIDITSDMFTGVAASYPYTGSAIEPSVTTSLTSSDYSVSYGTNTTVADGGSITITGTGDYGSSVTINFTITAKAITSDMFSVTTSNQTYTGTAIEPSVSTTTDYSALVEDTDYTVTYSDNTDVGTATITIEGITNYDGTLYYYFNIVAPTADDPADDPSDAPTELSLTDGSATIATNGYYAVPTDDESITGWSITVDGVDSGIVYSPGITFYVPADTTLTITAIGGAS